MLPHSERPSEFALDRLGEGDLVKLLVRIRLYLTLHVDHLSFLSHLDVACRGDSQL